MRVTFTVAECAEMLGVHPDTVRAAIERGELRATRLGRQWLIPASEVERIAAGE